MSSLLTFALKSPIKIFIRYLGNCPEVVINILFSIEKCIVVCCLISLPFPPNLPLNLTYTSLIPPLLTWLCLPCRHLMFQVPNLMSFFLCLCHAKASVQVWGTLKHFTKIQIFYGERLLAPTPKPQTGGPPLVSCPQLLIQYIRSYPL
jgi:hypothetical protein